MKGIPASHKRAIVVLGTPNKVDMKGRMAKAIELMSQNSDAVLVAVGTLEEATFMEEIALENGVPPSKLISNKNSRNTIDNAYHAKLISNILNIREESLVTSEYHLPRALATFIWVFGPKYRITPYASENLTDEGTILRERILAGLTSFLTLFEKGDHEGLKKASDMFVDALEGN